MSSPANAGRNFAAMLAGDLTNKVLRLLAAIVLARTLPLDQFGLLNVAIAVSGVAVVLTTLGLPDVGARDIAIEPRRAGEIAGKVISVRLLALGGLAAAGWLVVGLLLPRHSWLFAAGAAMALFMAVSAEWVARGLERMRGLGFAWIAGGATVLSGSILVALTGPTASVALAAFAAGEAVIAGVCWLLVLDTARPSPSLRGVSAFLRRSWPVGLSTVIVYSYFANIDTVILAAARSADEAGLYSAPYRTFLVFNIVGSFAAYAVMPALARYSAAGHEPAANAYLVRVLRLLACYGVGVVGLSLVGGREIISLLFGERFAPMAPTFTVLCIGAAWYVVGAPAGHGLIAADRNRRFLAGAAIAGVLNLTLNLALIPPFGTLGAATATTLALFAASLTWLAGRRIIGAATALLLSGLIVTSAAAIVAVAAPGGRLIVGLGLIGGAVVAALALTRRWNRLEYERAAGAS